MRRTVTTLSRRPPRWRGALAACALSWLGACDETASAPGDGGVDVVRAPPGVATYRTCARGDRDPEGGFCDATSRWGLTAPVDVRNGMRAARGGLTAADFDGDGRVDLLVTPASDVAPMLWMRRGDRWVDEATTRGLGALRRTLPSAAADLDGDGDQDLAVAFLDGDRVRLMRNDDGRFVEAAALGDAEEIAALLPADLDRDGRLDLLVAALSRDGTCVTGPVNRCPAGVRAYRQVSPWVFEPARVDAPTRRAQALAVVDWDDDGRDEVLAVTDFGMFDGGNLALRVNPVAGGGFTLSDATAGTGFDQQVFAMGVHAIDVGGDGVDEILVTSFGRNVLTGRRNGARVDMATELGADAYGVLVPGRAPVFRPFDTENRIEGPLARFQSSYLDMTSPALPTTKWTPVVFDADDDGLADVFMPAGAIGLDDYLPERSSQQGALLMGTPAGLRDRTEALHASTTRDANAALAVDLDEDGDLDLAVFHMAFAGVTGGLTALRNDMSAGRSLAVVARGRGAARDGIGARVEVRTAHSAQRRRLDGNLSIFGSAPHEARFGLGDDTEALSVEVRFVSGAVVRREHVAAGRVVVEE